MKVVILSKALHSIAYRRKTDAIAAQPGIELTVVVPPSWREPRAAEVHYETGPTPNYRVVSLPMMFNGRHHIHWYPGFARLLRTLTPDVVHVDEESFNAATAMAIRAADRIGAASCFYNYANIERTYPPPFGWFEQYVFRTAAHGIACSHEAAAIIQRHGYTGPLSILPQTGVDPDVYTPSAAQPVANESFMLGYVGRFVPEKGIADLIIALALLPEQYCLTLVGAGSDEQRLRMLAQTSGVAHRITWNAPIATTDMPAMMRSFDLLVLPSRTTANWKEQFGRVLIEAMACGVPTVGSDSGEIPHVIGNGGRTFAEGDTAALAQCISAICSRPALHTDLRRSARQRILDHYTQQALATQYVAIYHQMHASHSAGVDTAPPKR